MRHRVLARLWTLSSLLQIPLVACSPLGASPLVVAMHDPPHLSVWLISQAIHVEMAAIHQSDPGRASRSLPWLFLNQSLLLFLLFYSSLLSYGGAFFLCALPLHFDSSSGSISLSGWKTTEDLPVLEAIRLHLMCLPPSPSLVGVKRRTPCYIRVNRQRWRGRVATGPFCRAGRDCLSRTYTMNDWWQHGNDTAADTG